MKFRSKVDWWYYLIVFFFTASTFRVCYDFLFIFNTKINIGLLLLFILGEFVILLPNLFFTYYIFEETDLYVRYGYIYCKYIPYNDIVKIRETRSAFASCGLAMNRIEITYKFRDSIEVVMIAPKNRQEVMQILTEKIKNRPRPDHFILSLPGQDDSYNKPMDGIIH